jgi:hypothetical protein
LASDPDKTLVLFASDTELREFRRRLAIYRQGKPPDQKDASYASLFAFVDDVVPIEPVDRIGPRLLAAGVKQPIDLIETATFTLDAELWDPGNAQQRKWYVDKLRVQVDKLGGSVPSFTYAYGALLLLRVRGPGRIMRELLEIAEVRSLDLPPQPDLIADDMADLTIHDFDDPPPPPEDAPRIGLIDSGMSKNPLLASAIALSIGVPASLGDADDHGHGTKVGAICIYGDVAATAAEDAFRPAFWLCSAKVIDANGEFDPDVLVHV